MLTVVLTAAALLLVPPPPVAMLKTQVALAVERHALPVGIQARQPDPMPGDWRWWVIPADRPARMERSRDAARGPPLSRVHQAIAPPFIGDGLAHNRPPGPAAAGFTCAGACSLAWTQHSHRRPAWRPYVRSS